jgi:predicted phage terminase large subunit-like protein
MTRIIILAALLCAALPSPAHGTLGPDTPDEVADPPTARVKVPEGTHVAWAPNPGPQTRFLSFGGYEGLYGGAAGGGKSDALLAGALRYVERPRYTAVIFRRTFPDLERSIIERSRQIIPAAYPTARYNEQKKYWRFPSGARLLFAHLEHEHSVRDHQGAEYQYIGFDELTHFTEKQYTYLLSRGRSADGLPIRIRGATNPGGDGHEWVMRRWAPWLDPEATLRALPGQVLHYINDPAAGERYVPKGTLDAQGTPALARVFVPAKVEDNPRIGAEYVSTLNGLDAVTRAQLRDGNWLIKPARGLYFKRAWFRVVEAAPAEVAARVRYWDLAGSPDGDWAVGVKMSKTKDGLYFVEHVERGRGTPNDVRAMVRATAELDGHDVEQHVEQDPGQAGKDQVQSYARLLEGYTMRARAKRVDKVTAAGPYSSQVEAGNVRLVAGRWHADYIAELEAFPEDKHDDQVDASSGAFTVLNERREIVWIG